MPDIGPVSLKLQLLGILTGLVIVGLILYLVRKGQLKAGYALMWLLLGIGVLITSMSTNLLNLTAFILGVYYAPAALFMLIILGIIAILIHYSTVISRQEEKLKTLIQEIGLLKHEIENRNKKNK